MPRNGTGGYSLPSNSWNPAVNGAAATASDWQALINDVATAIQQSVSADGQTPMTGSLNMGGFVVTGLGAPSGAGQSLRWEQLTKGSDIASANTITIPNEGNVFDVTGTTQINTINDTYPGRITYLIFDDAVVLKNSASLVLPSGTDITTKAGEAYGILNDAPGVWRVLTYPNRIDVESGAIPTGGYKNALINGNFLVNQRAVSGSVVLAGGAYGHDRWKAGAGGCTYTFSTSNNVTTLTISAGTLVQVIEGANLSSGTYTLSWGGTSQGKIGAGSFSGSGVTGSVSGGVNLSIEFGTGTLSRPQLEVGSVPSPFELRPLGVETSLCQRYFLVTQNDTYIWSGNTTSGSTYYLNCRVLVTMRATPTVVAATASAQNGFPTSFSLLVPLSPNAVSASKAASSTVSGGYFYAGLTLSAEL
jgi:hypothetical protein